LKSAVEATTMLRANDTGGMVYRFMPTRTRMAI
jgi:hypothetical protein